MRCGAENACQASPSEKCTDEDGLGDCFALVCVMTSHRKINNSEKSMRLRETKQ